MTLAKLNSRVIDRLTISLQAAINKEADIRDFGASLATWQKSIFNSVKRKYEAQPKQFGKKSYTRYTYGPEGVEFDEFEKLALYQVCKAVHNTINHEDGINPYVLIRNVEKVISKSEQLDELDLTTLNLVCIIICAEET